jgi:uncharacterized membrane protein
LEATNKNNGRGFPTAAGIFLGLGLGGFFDGIILHQVLQWHHMLTSAGYPPDDLGNLKFNVMWDGFFHIWTYLFTLFGMTTLWSRARQPHAPWSGKMLVGTMLMGFGIFNLVEGIIDHHLLGIHHVNETVPPDQWVFWDIGFLALGVILLIGGWLLRRAGQRETALASRERQAGQVFRDG